MRSFQLTVACLALLASGAALAQTAPPIVAVFRVEDKGAGLDDKTIDQLTSYLEAAISEGNVYRIVPQATIKKALVEKKQESYQECYELSCQIELGRELAAEKSLSTAILRIGEGCTVTAALYDLKTQVSDATAKEPMKSCDQQDLRVGIDKAATKLKAYRGGGDSGSGFQEGRIGAGGETWQVGKGKKAIVSFASTPVSAMVMVDGKVVCERTPCSRTVAEGLHEVAMLNERYQAHRERLALAKGSKVDWELKPNFGWLTVRSEPAGQSVLVNGESLGVTPLERRELAPGGYEVLVKSPCHAEAGERVVIELGEEKEVSIRLAERQAAVEVSAKDQDGNDLEAEVLVDGLRLGETP
ncbi:MAG TPA: PEGA domain-containing protein, partial [Myxococcota bacterium]|nr:PEGA domain-containing protein [Myxococcota bacterium]